MRSDAMRQLAHPVSATAINVSAAMPAGPNRGRFPALTLSGGSLLSSEDVPAIHLSSSARSRVVCQRSSGSLARHFRMIRSSAGGKDDDVTKDGSVLSTAAMTAAVLPPSNAFLADN